MNIISNGAKWRGQAPDDLSTLYKVLGEYPLDRTFERYGNFVMVEPELIGGGKLDGKVRFFGNFLTLSHVFNIEMDVLTERAEIDQLCAAIEDNQRRQDYLRQPSRAEQEAAAAARIDKEWRHRMERRRQCGFA